MTQRPKTKIHAQTKVRKKIHAQVRSEPPIATETYLAENSRAWQRIGQTFPQVANWFLTFGQRKLTELSAGQWSDLQYEVGALSEYRVLAPSEPSLFWNRAFALRDWSGRDKGEASLDLKTPPTMLPPRVDIESLHSEVVEHLSSLADKPGITALAFPAATVAVSKGLNTDSTFTICTVSYPADLFRYTFLTTLCWTAHRIRRCKSCSKVFYADRRNKEYCSTACQNLAGTRRWRDKQMNAASAKRRGKHGTQRPKG